MDMPSRRAWARAAVAGFGTLLAGRSVRAQMLEQPVSPGPRAFMDRALAMRQRALAEGDQGFGAIVVRDGQIIGEAPSAVVTRADPTAHAEMEAIRDAARRIGQRDLRGAILYSSSRPCAMCEAAAFWAGIARMIHGEALTDGGAPRLSRC
jgi:tRNA(Arg) A34 adenosine deaminase TadA